MPKYRADQVHETPSYIVPLLSVSKKGVKPVEFTIESLNRIHDQHLELKSSINEVLGENFFDFKYNPISRVAFIEEQEVNNFFHTSLKHFEIAIQEIIEGTSGVGIAYLPFMFSKIHLQKGLVIDIPTTKIPRLGAFIPKNAVEFNKYIETLKSYKESTADILQANGVEPSLDNVRKYINFEIAAIGRLIVFDYKIGITGVVAPHEDWFTALKSGAGLTESLLWLSRFNRDRKNNPYISIDSFQEASGIPAQWIVEMYGQKILEDRRKGFI